MTILSVKKVQKSFKKKQALNIERLDIEKGELIGIVGNNGAGKTTLFRAILDLLKLDSGVIWIGDDVVAGSMHWKKMLHAFLDESFLIEFLKPNEYFEFIGKTLGMDKKQVKAQLDLYPELHNEDILESSKLIRELSTGSKVRVGLLATLLGDPEMILLDEPYAHLDPSSQAKLSKLIKQLNEKGTTVILSSHNLHNVAQICSRIVLIEAGEVIKDEAVSDRVITEVNQYFGGE
ncbi:MAG: ATP-binding protein [Flammeovirgaceae bacterium]|nr:ATP-binding protein [Flammeovirgaceae bacterium]HCX22126.1 ATP-binding protein [Cytophagales bacterium]|tara:strand:+ start:371 stop:1072 length:702 start_codon:yes stop_codon:yes gene_type:complete